MLSLAFLTTQKAAFIGLFFVIRWSVAALRERRAGLLIEPCLVAAVPVLFTVGWLWRVQALDAWIGYNVIDAVAHVARRAEQGGSFSPLFFLLLEGQRNVLFTVAVLVGLPRLAFLSGSGGDAEVARSRFLVGLARVGVATLWLNPFPYPYLHVTVLPLLAIVAAVSLARGLPRGTSTGRVMVPLILLLAVTTSGPRLWEKAHSSNAHQLEHLRLVTQVTAPEDPVFDLVGLYFRPDAYDPPTMTGTHIARYRLGGFPPIVPQLRERTLAAAIMNYRTAWLPTAEQDFLAAHLTHFDGNVFVLGVEIRDPSPGEQQTFEVLRTKSFRWEGDAVARRRGAVRVGHIVRWTPRPHDGEGGRGGQVATRCTPTCRATRAAPDPLRQLRLRGRERCPRCCDWPSRLPGPTFHALATQQDFCFAA